MGCRTDMAGVDESDHPVLLVLPGHEGQPALLFVEVLIACPSSICLFICLRNATPYLRGTYASGLALMGRHSLELYLLQFHVSAAASSSTLVDTRDCNRQRRLGSP
jgi:peptidoglycan/LPS O-acetylase OafA/YrhL